MRVRVGFDNRHVGDLSVRDGRIDLHPAAGASRETLAEYVETYARLLHAAGKPVADITPEAILTEMATRMTGRAWCRVADAE